MPTGLKSYYIMCRYETMSGWVNWTFVKIGSGGYVNYVGTRLEATPFKTHDDAEKAAFNLVAKDPSLIGLLKVELMGV